jgi:hypothetical protein
MKYDLKKSLFMAKNFDKFRKISSVQRAWRTKFKSKDAPSRHVILFNYNKLENTGSVNHLPRSEPLPNETSQNAKIAIEELIKENASLSIRKLSVAAQTLYGTARSILLDDLGLKPYHRKIFHEQEPTDHQKRIRFA